MSFNSRTASRSKPLRTFSAMNDRIAVYQLQKVGDGQGGKTVTKVSLGTFWADLKQLQLNQKSYAMAQGYDYDYKALVRNSEVFIPGLQVEWGTKVLLITFVANIEGTEYTNLYLKVKHNG